MVIIMVFARRSRFCTAASAFFLGIIPVVYTILCNINNVSGYYPFTVWGLALLGFFISCSMAVFSLPMINSKHIKRTVERDEDVCRFGLAQPQTSITEYSIEKGSNRGFFSEAATALHFTCRYRQFCEYNRIYGNEKADGVFLP